MNKRGDVTEIFTFLIILFFLAVAFLVVGFANNEIKNVIDEELSSTTTGNRSSEQLDNINTNSIQTGFVVIFGFVIIGMMISSFMVRIHPIFIFMYIIFLATAIFLAVPIANAYQLISEADVLEATAANQSMIVWVMEHLVLITLGVGALSMIVVFAKLAKSDGGVG
jgi:hypothetical protein